MSLLVIGKVWPEPASSAAGTRILQLIELFQDFGYQVTFASAAGKSEYSINLTHLNIETQAISLNDSSFDEFISDLNPDVVLFDRFMTEEQFGWRVAEHTPKALRILDTEDLHFLREARRLAILKNEEPENCLINDSTLRELASIYRCDLSLIISEFEMGLLRDEFKIPENMLHYIPLLVDWSQLNPVHETPSFEEREHFVSIGNFLHPPNLDSVRYLKKEIWPLIRKRLPNAELHVYGAYPSQEVMEMHKPEKGFIVKGRADDAFEVIQNSRVLLAPLRFGAGLKGKLFDAMLTGTPSVTTNIGAEGMIGDSDWPGFVEDDPHYFAEKAVRLYSNKSVWKDAQERIAQNLEERFLNNLFENHFKEVIEALTKNLSSHRKQNIIGQMLQHQSNAATKFMGKWIEEKNRNL